MSDARFRGGSALVTGASSGVGEAFARALAARGANVLLTALPDEREALERIASELSAAHGVRTELVTADLGAPDGPAGLVEAVRRLEFEPNILVNSAGFGLAGLFVEQSLERQLAMIRVNALAPVALVGAFLPRMVERGDGIVVNLSSTAALQPVPHFAAYAASKTFVLAFGEALWAEVQASGVRTVTVCPGPVSTQFHERAGDPGNATGIKLQLRRGYLPTDAVIAATFEALEANRPRVVLRVRGWGLLYAFATKAGLFVPRRWSLLLSERVSRWVFPAS